MASSLIKAAKRGVKVSILMSEFPFGPNKGSKNTQQLQRIKKKGGESVEIRLTVQEIMEGPLYGKKLHIHAKVMIIDGHDTNDFAQAFMYLGSTNFYKRALDEHRNLGVITRDVSYIQPVCNQFWQDWDVHPDAKVTQSLDDEIIPNVEYFMLGVEQENRGLHDLANHSYHLAFEEKKI